LGQTGQKNEDWYFIAAPGQRYLEIIDIDPGLG